LSAGRLAAAAVRSNAVNSSVTARRATQAATMQSSRINAKAITQAAASQIVSCLFSTAVAKRTARIGGIRVGNFMCSFATNTANLYSLRPDSRTTFVTTSTTRLPLNSMPTKLSLTSIVRAARHLAKLELTSELISERMGVSACDTKIRTVCEAIDSRCGALDSVWCAFILISFLTSHHTGRAILRGNTNLTDMDYQTAAVFENYGRGEITRRARLEASQRAPSKRQKVSANKSQTTTTITPKQTTTDSPCVKQEPRSDPSASIELVGALQGTRIGDEFSERVEAGDTDATDEIGELGEFGALGTEVTSPSEASTLPIAVSMEVADETPKGGDRESCAIMRPKVEFEDDESEEDDFDLTTDPTEAIGSALVEAEDRKELLAVKRKRGARNYAASSAVDSACLLSWWLAALQHGQASVLFSLVSQSKATAKAAAQLTLQSQAQGCSVVAKNQRIIEISEQNAIESASALVPLVGRCLTDTPAILVWTHKSRELRSIMRTSDEHRTTMAMAMVTPHHALEPRVDTKMWISWMEASIAFMPYTDVSTFVPGIMEKLVAADEFAKHGKRSKVVASRMRASALMDAEQPRTPHTSGLTRSIISLEMTVRIDPSVIKAGKRLGEDLINASAQPNVGAANSSNPSSSNPDADLEAGSADEFGMAPKLLSCTHDSSETRLEPMLLPSSPLATGLQMGEQLREWFSGKTRRNNPVKAPLSSICASELIRDVPAVINQEPPPLMQITDVEAEMCGVEADDVVDDAIEEEAQTVLTKMAVTLHVCGDAAVRVPEAIGIFQKLYEGNPLLIAQRTRSLLLGAINQASWVADVGPAITAGWSNSAIQSSRKVAVADSHRLLFLSPFDAYVVGLSSLEKAHPGSRYSSTYGSSLDTGLTPPGLLGSNYRADRRQHGALTLSQETADESSEHFAHAHFRPVGDSAYVEIPAACRGIPHSLPVSLYTGLDGLESALDDVRRGVGKANDNFVAALQVLPFSPWTQALSPYIDLASDPTIRLGVRDATSNSFNNGTAYLPDSTSFKDAIAREPLIRRPSQLSSQDNPFLTPHGSIESFFCCASTIALYARQIGGLDATHAAITRLVSNEAIPAHEAVLTLDVLLLINLMYPTTWKTPEAILLPALEHAIPMLQKFVATTLHQAEAEAEDVPTIHSPLAPTLQALLEQAANTFAFNVTEVFDEIQTYWAAFCRTNADNMDGTEPSLCAWTRGVSPLLAAIDANDGSHSVSTATRDEIRRCLEKSIRCAYLVHSPDGVAPPVNTPMAACNSPTDVRRGVLDPIWVSTRTHKARSALVGLKPHALRQATILAMAAELPGVRVQVIRNEGGLSLRVSSAADVLDQHGRPRSEKSISPLQVEGASSTFGDRSQKVWGCEQQRVAWDMNVKLMMPIMTSINAPRSLARRDRGSVYSITEALLRATRSKRDAMLTAEHEDEAVDKLVQAAQSPLGVMSRKSVRLATTGAKE
jgi:hypothetical protein